METSGRPTEAWMTIVPLTVFVLIVLFALGGPTAFMRVVTDWASEISSSVFHWLRNL